MTQKFTSDRPTIDEIRALKKPNVRSVTLVMDPEAAREIKELERAYDRERRTDERENRPAKAPAIRKAIEDLKDRVADSEVTFTFRDIGRKRFDDMVVKHPPTPAQKKQGELQNIPVEFNIDTFAPELLASTAIEPSMTLAQATDLYNEWGQGEIQALFMTALAACTERASIPFSRTAIDETIASVLNSTTAASEGSPMDGSSEEIGSGEMRTELKP